MMLKMHLFISFSFSLSLFDIQFKAFWLLLCSKKNYLFISSLRRVAYLYEPCVLLLLHHNLSKHSNELCVSALYMQIPGFNQFFP